MKALFCYDGPMYKTENGEYYDSILNDQMFQRYLQVADELELIIRTREIDSATASQKMHKLTDSRISVCECPNLSSVRGLLHGRALAKRIMTEKIKDADLVFIRIPSVIGNLSIDICRDQNKAYLLEVVGCPWDSYWNYSLKGKIVAPVATFQMRTRTKHAPYVVYVTKEFLQHRYPTVGKTINCSNVELMKVDQSILEARLKRIAERTAKEQIVIGTAAGLDVPYKGQKYVIAALGKLKKQGLTNYRYSLVGGGTGERLRQFAKECDVEDQIDIVGQIPHDKVFDWLKSIDLYAQPSLQEGLPRAVIEAMSYGIPCIGSRVAGIPELLSSDMLFKGKDIDGIVAILKNLSSDRMSQIAKENYEKAKDYDIEVLKRRRLAFFREFTEEVGKRTKT